MSTRDARGRFVKADPVAPSDPALISGLKIGLTEIVCGLAIAALAVVAMVAGLAAHHAG